LQGWFSHSIHSPITQIHGESKLGAKGRGERALEWLGAILAECFSQWNEWAMVRMEETGIYTPRQNLTVQIYIGSSDVDLKTSDVRRKHCSRKVKSPRVQVSVRTSDKRRDFRRSSGLSTGTDSRSVEPSMPGLPAWVRTSDCREFWLTSGLPTSTVTAQAVTGSLSFRQESWLPTVGSFGLRRDFRHRQSQKIILCAREVLECLSFDFIIMLEHSIFLRPPKLASLLIVRHTY
jgi:hypothetical protein